MKKEKVIIRKCDSYSVNKIERIINDAVEELGIELKGNIFIKPNEVIAHPRHFKHAYTHPAVIEAIIRVLKDRPVKEMMLGGKSGLTIPTRHVFRHAKYMELIRAYNKVDRVAGKNINRPKLRAVYFDEEKQVRIAVDGKVHEELHLPKRFYDADLKIYLPKLKANCCSRAVKGGKLCYGITNALKLNMGIIDDKERKECHHYYLDEKIADLLAVGNPNLVVTDAIVIGSGASPLTAKPYPLNAIIIGSNAVAVDSVCASVLGYDARDIAHILECNKRRYGPVALDDILVSGDISIEELKLKGNGWNPEKFISEMGYKNLKFYTGVMPEGKYCFAGCPAAISEAIGILEEFTGSSADDFFEDSAIIFGAYKGNNVVKAKNIILAGKCSSVERYEGKMYKIPGCPITIPKGILKMWHYSGSGLLRLKNKPKNPYLDLENALPFITDFVVSKINRFKNRIV